MYAIQHIHEAGVGNTNEDDLLLLPNRNVFGVFDGMTSLVPFSSSEGKTGGKIAAELAKEAFASADQPLHKLARDANRAIRDAMLNAHVPLTERESLWSCEAAVVRLDREFLECFVTGDSLLLIVGNDDEPIVPLGYEDHDAKALLRWSELSSQGRTDELHTLLVDLRRKLNVEYGSLNGEAGAEQFFRYSRIPRAKASTIIIATDGLLIPKKDPGAPNDWQRFVSLYRSGGLNAILEHVRQLEKTDPTCSKFPRYKQHDDVAAISIDLS